MKKCMSWCEQNLISSKMFQMAVRQKCGGFISNVNRRYSGTIRGFTTLSLSWCVQQTLAEVEEQLDLSQKKTHRPTEQRKCIFKTETCFNSWTLGQIRQHQDRAFDQAVSCRPFTTNTQVQLQTQKREFAVENVALGRASHYEHLVTNVSYWVIRLWSTSLNLRIGS